MCCVLGHNTYTVGMPMPDGSHIEVLAFCIRCDYSKALVDLTS